MVKTKTLKSTTPKKCSSEKGYRYVGEYKDFFTKRMIPVSEAFLEKLSEDLVDWAMNNKNALTARSFWFVKGISPTIAKKWMQRAPVLKEAYEVAKERIGIRREEGSLKKTFDSATFFRTALNYSPEFKETGEWQTKIKQQANQEAQKNAIQWVLGKFPSSDVVPEKKKDEDKE